MKFIKIDEHIRGAEAVVRYESSKALFPIAFRLDSRDGNGWRVDRTSRRLPLPWEAIDGGKPCRTLREAKALCRRYLRACEAQETLTPTFER